MYNRISVAAAGIAMGLCGSALSAQTFTNASGDTVTFYGQLNPAFLHVDDGEQSHDNVVDNDSWESLVGFKMDFDRGDNKLELHFEAGLGFRQSYDMTQDGNLNYMDWDKTDLRYFEAVYTTKKYGTFYAGQGEMAADGGADSDLSSTADVTEASVGDMNGGYRFRTKSGEISSVHIYDVLEYWDSNREFRVRYDTPNLLSGNSNLNFAVSYGHDVLDGDDTTKYTDGAAYYHYDGPTIEVKAAAGYMIAADDGDQNNTWNASGAILDKPTGLSLAVAHSGAVTSGDLKQNFNYVKVGWARDGLIGKGTTGFSVDYGQGDDYVTDGDKAKAIGAAVTQNWKAGPADALDMTAYLGWRRYSYDDDSSASYQDINAVMVGMRIAF